MPTSAQSPAERDTLATSRLLTFFRSRNGSWKTPTGENWQPALALDAVINTYQRTHERRYRDVIEKSFARYRGRRSRFYDDDGWFLNAWLRAYDVTGDPRYLEEATDLFTAMTRAWDGHCGGGLWWHQDRTYKNAITNELFLLAAVRLHRRVPDDAYLDWALRTWAWFDASGMINASNEINDGLDGGCANNGDTTWTYNQGVILGALAELWRITGEHGYLDRARQIADATIATHVHPGGILKEPCEPDGCNADSQIFKGVFAQGLARLYHADPDRGGRYLTFLTHNADTLWDAGSDPANGFGLLWTGPAGDVTAATQASGSLLIGAVALLTTGGEATPRPAPAGWNVRGTVDASGYVAVRPRWRGLAAATVAACVLAAVGAAVAAAVWWGRSRG